MPSGDAQKQFVFLVSELKWDESGPEISSDVKVIGIFSSAKAANAVVATWHQRDYVPVEAKDFDRYALTKSHGLLNLFASWQKQAWEISVEEIEVNKEFSMSLLEPTKPGVPVDAEKTVSALELAVQGRAIDGSFADDFSNGGAMDVEHRRRKRSKANGWTNPKSSRKRKRSASIASINSSSRDQDSTGRCLPVVDDSESSQKSYVCGPGISGIRHTEDDTTTILPVNETRSRNTADTQLQNGKTTGDTSTSASGTSNGTSSTAIPTSAIRDTLSRERQHNCMSISNLISTTPSTQFYSNTQPFVAMSAPPHYRPGIVQGINHELPSTESKRYQAIPARSMNELTSGTTTLQMQELYSPQNKSQEVNAAIDKVAQVASLNQPIKTSAKQKSRSNSPSKSRKSHRANRRGPLRYEDQVVESGLVRNKKTGISNALVHKHSTKSMGQAAQSHTTTAPPIPTIKRKPGRPRIHPL